MSRITFAWRNTLWAWVTVLERSMEVKTEWHCARNERRTPDHRMARDWPCVAEKPFGGQSCNETSEGAQRHRQRFSRVSLKGHRQLGSLGGYKGQLQAASIAPILLGAFKTHIHKHMDKYPCACTCTWVCATRGTSGHVEVLGAHHLRAQGGVEVHKEVEDERGSRSVRPPQVHHHPFHTPPRPSC